MEKSMNIKRLHLLLWLFGIVALGSLIIIALLIENKPKYTLEEVTPSLTKTFVILGDTGSGSAAEKEVGNSVSKYCTMRDCQYAFIVGDVIYDTGVKSVNDTQFMTKFEQPFQGVNFPFYIAFGNHDYLGCTQCYIDYSKISAKWKMPSRYYDLIFQDLIHFFVIDTENFNSEEENWLKTSIQDAKEPFKIVLGHRPIVTYDIVHFEENWTGKEKLKDIICNDADIYFAGHAHLLEDIGKLDECKVRQLVSGGGGESPRGIFPLNHEKFYYQGNGFIALTLGDNSLNVEYITEKGELVYTTKIN